MSTVEWYKNTFTSGYVIISPCLFISMKFKIFFVNFFVFLFKENLSLSLTSLSGYTWEKRILITSVQNTLIKRKTFTVRSSFLRERYH